MIPMSSETMTAQTPVIKEVYKDYMPIGNATKSVRALLKYVPPIYVSGLHEIVLTNTSALSRERRRQRLSSHSGLEDVGGLYHQAWQGQPAWIEIFVDKTFSIYPAILTRLPFIRNMALAEVLYHEVGHHAQHTMKLKLGSDEDSADKFQRKLTQAFVRGRYWYLQPVIRAIRAVAGIAKRIRKVSAVYG